MKYIYININLYTYYILSSIFYLVYLEALAKEYNMFSSITWPVF